MQHLFLSSSADDAGAADSIYRRIGLHKPKTAFIYTPTEAEAMIGMKTWEGEERAALNKAGFATFDYTITGKNLDQINADLADIDVLYISGGNEFYFREMCDESNFEQFVQSFVASGKPYIGTSCGSIMASHDISPTQKLNDLSLLKKPINTKGFGFVNFSILPHWGLADFKEGYTNDSFDILFQSKLPLIALNNYEYIEVLGDSWQIVDVRHEK